MRTEYTIKMTDKRGKVQTSVYPKRIAFNKAESARDFYTAKGWAVEFWKVCYNGASIYNAERIW